MKSKKWIKLLLTGIFLGGLLCFWKLIGSMFLADVYSARSEKSLENLDFNSSIKFAEKAIALNSMEPAYYRREAKLLLISPAGGNNSRKELALKDIQTSIDLNSKNLATLRNSIPLLSYLALQDPNSKDSPSLDEQYLPFVRDFYFSLFEDYPNDVGILVSLAHYQRKLGLTKDLNQTLHRIELLRPDLLEWHPLLLEGN
jgi:hypothetical protein